MAMQNNTTGASIYDLGKIVQSDSIAELNAAMKDSEAKQQEQKQQEMQSQQQMQEQQIQAQQQEQQAERDFKVVQLKLMHRLRSILNSTQQQTLRQLIN